MIRKLAIYTYAWPASTQNRYYYLGNGKHTRFAERRRAHGPMPAKRNVHNSVEKCKTSHEAKTEV